MFNEAEKRAHHCYLNVYVRAVVARDLSIVIGQYLLMIAWRTIVVPDERGAAKACFH